MIMPMIGKLSQDWKVDWPKHLPELVHAYNYTRSAITGYSPHYLMFRHQPHLCIDFYFPMMRGTEKHQHVDYYIAELCEPLWETFKEAQAQSMSEADRQKWYYDRKANSISLEPGNLVLAKADAYRRKRKVKCQWEEEPYEVQCQVAEGVPSYLMKKQMTGCSQVLHQNWLFLITPTKGTPPLYGCAGWAGKVGHHHPRGTNSGREWDWGSAIKCELSATYPVTDTWDSSRLGEQEALCILQTFTRASLMDQGWKVWCRRTRGVQKSMSAFLRQRYWSHWWGFKDTTGHDNLNPTSLHVRNCKLITLGGWNGNTSLCINFWGNHFILNIDAMRTPGL